jgi:hypothetical protein
MAGDWRTIPRCPDCGGACERIEVDIGVGVQFGPRYCLECGWQEPEPDTGLLPIDENDINDAFAIGVDVDR